MTRLFLALSFTLILVGCSVQENRSEAKRVQEKREVPSFSRIVFAGVGDLVIHQGEKEGVELEGPSDLLPYVVTHVNNGTLNIEEKPRGWLESFKSRSTPFVAHLYLKNIEEVSLSGQGKLTSDQPLKSQNLTIKVSGAGKVDLALESNEFMASIAGAGDYRLKGKVVSQEIQISGSGSYEASDLMSEKTSIDIRGSGNADVNVNKELNVIITGAGVVRYTGTPQVTQKIFGSGKIEQLKSDKSQPAQ